MSKTVFLRAVRNATGYNGKDPALNEAFAQIDDDQEGFACFDEFSCWIDGRTGRRAMARSLTLASERPTDDPEFPPLREVQWDATVLLRELNRMLEHNGCSSYDLLSAHDSSSDGSLEKKEFIIMIKRLTPRITELYHKERATLKIQSLTKMFITKKMFKGKLER